MKNQNLDTPNTSADQKLTEVEVKMATKVDYPNGATRRHEVGDILVFGQVDEKLLKKVGKDKIFTFEKPYHQKPWQQLIDQVNNDIAAGGRIFSPTFK